MLSASFPFFTGDQEYEGSASMLRKHINKATSQRKKSGLKLTYTCIQCMHLLLYFELQLTALILLHTGNPTITLHL